MLLASGVTACAPILLTAGNYSETRGPGIILLEGRTLQLSSDHTFAYRHWSDDIGSDRYGVGTYRVAGNKLRLQFAPPLSEQTDVQTQVLTPRPDSLTAAFIIFGRPVMGAGTAQVVPGAFIAAYDDQGRVVAAVASDTAGRAVLYLPQTARQLRVQALGLTSWQQACPATSTSYRLTLPASAGTPYTAGTVKVFGVLSHNANELVLRQGKMRLVLRSQPMGKESGF